ncbi:ribosome maturation factor RimM, partial [Chloroflexota bacterium]
MSVPEQKSTTLKPEAGDQPVSDTSLNLPAKASPSFLILGRIQRPHGVRGEMRIRVITDYPERIADLETVYLGTDPYNEQTATAYPLTSIRGHRDQLLIKLEGITSRDDVEPLRQQLLMVALENAVPLEAGEYYVFEILGTEVITTDGQNLGRVSEVLETGANDVFVVTGGPYGEVLIPDIPEVVLEIDLEDNRVIV